MLLSLSLWLYISRYFTFPFEEMNFEEEMQLMEQREKACYILAHDGFVKGKDLQWDFAEPGKQQGQR